MYDLGSNLLIDLVVAIILVFLGWIIRYPLRLPFVFQRRRELLRFFGLTEEHPNLNVYLSTVFVRTSGAVDFRNVARTFAGPAIPSAELGTIEPITNLFFDPLLSELSPSFREWLATKVHWSFQSISPLILGSPRTRDEVGKGSILTVGSRYYNSAADYYIEFGNPVLLMEQVQNRMIIRVNVGPRTNDVFEPRDGRADDLAIVEKIFDTNTNSTVIFAAGLGVVGTVGAVNFIVDNWEKLKDDFGFSPFSICLRFQDVVTDPKAFKKPVELFRYPS
jgi:hypothetical protein